MPPNPQSLAKMRRFLSLPPETLVRVYTMQEVNDVEAAEKRGYFTGSLDHFGEEYDFFVHAYKWMVGQMAARIENFSGDFPVWAWLKRPRRAFRKGDKERGERVRITAMVPRCRILPSDFHDWHCVLNKWPLTRSEAEWDEYDAAFPKNTYSPEQMSFIERNWPDIFEFAPREGEVLEHLGSNKWVDAQLCIDRLYWNEIVGIRVA